MSWLSETYATERPDHVQGPGWTLCSGCSKAKHTECAGRCDCDLDGCGGAR